MITRGDMKTASQLKYLLEVVAFSEDGHSVGNTMEARSPPWQCVGSLLNPVPETLSNKCTLCYYIAHMLTWAEYPDAEREKLLLLVIPKSPKLSMLKKNRH